MDAAPVVAPVATPTAVGFEPLGDVPTAELGQNADTICAQALGAGLNSFVQSETGLDFSPLVQSEVGGQVSSFVQSQVPCSCLAVNPSGLIETASIDCATFNGCAYSAEAVDPTWNSICPSLGSYPGILMMTGIIWKVIYKIIWWIHWLHDHHKKSEKSGKGGKKKSGKGGGGKGGGVERARRHHRRAATEAQECHMFQSKGVTVDEAALQQNVQVVMNHMDDQGGFSVDTLRSLYKSLLSDLDLEEIEDMTQEQMDLLVEDTLIEIDTNGDGKIDPKELASMELSVEMSDFVFDDVVACTSSNFKTASGEACVTPDNVVEFMNNFYAGTKVVSPTMADQIREQSGADACYTRVEFEAAFASNDAPPSASAASVQSLSAGTAGQPTCAWTTAAVGAVGTAMFVAGI